jgi:hypothetical protein
MVLNQGDDLLIDLYGLRRKLPSAPDKLAMASLRKYV